MLRLRKGKPINRYIYDNIPSTFVTIGIFGTFVGIYLGLRAFDVDNITDSIPTLLSGLKTAFSTSIAGIICSIVLGKLSLYILNHAEMNTTQKPIDEISALQELIVLQKDLILQNKINFQNLNDSLVGETDKSITTSLTKLRNQLAEFVNDESKLLQQISTSLGGDGDTSLLTQIQKLREEQRDYTKETKLNIDLIIESMNKNNLLISNKFDEFSELLAKNNGDALVEAMKGATEAFNVQMSAIIERLVQENFKELNDSVLQMNRWQQENMEMINILTKQFVQVSEDFTISASSIKEITENTAKLTNENSHLSALITELQKVLIDDKKFQDITGKITTTVDTLQQTTDSFDETTNKLNTWVKNQMNFSDSTAKLLVRLEEIDKIKDINEVFWNDTKKQLNDGVSIIADASSQLSKDIENLNTMFYDQLNDTFNNLDTLIQRIIENYKPKR